MTRPGRSQPWFERSLRRNLLDFHIADWHPDFLSRYDPEHFAECVARLGSTAATVFANTHTGLCNYPTRVGEMHAGHRGRDVLGETIAALHARDIDVVIYYVMIFADWYWDRHPEARIVDARGDAKKVFISSSGRPRRFSTTCPNEPGYRDFVVAQVEEIRDAYEFEGVWPDMTFWPTVCYCASCRERYAREVGGELPRTIDWADPRWVGFQRKRQAWMADFGRLVTESFRKGRPELSVAHQSLAFHAGWSAGGSVELAGVTDWLSADLYGERYGLSFFAKQFHSLSTRKPFEHINTWCWPNIHEHVITRTEDHLRLTAFSALMNHGAMVLIDAIDPLGTVHAANYDLAGRVYADLARYEGEIGGRFCQDVGIYYSFDSNVDLTESGQDVAAAGYTFDDCWKQPTTPTAHRNAAMALARTLIQAHLPFGVVTRRDLGRLDDWQVIVLSNAACLGEDEVEALRGYVARGGHLVASKHTSLITREGRRLADFALADVLGVSYAGETADSVTYVCPAALQEQLFPGFSEESPITLYDTQALVRAQPDAEVLATITLPWTHPTEARYAAILTDPPGEPTSDPAIVRHAFGKGQALYFAGVIESWPHETQQAVLLNLLRTLLRRPAWVEMDAPKSVEATLFLQEDRDRFVLCVINYQKELPNIPVHDLVMRVRLDGRTPRAVSLLPQRDQLDWVTEADQVEVHLPVLRDFVMLEIDLAPTTGEHPESPGQVVTSA
jgi:hypothetical protein